MQVFTILEHQEIYPVLVSCQSLTAEQLGKYYRNLIYLNNEISKVAHTLFHDGLVANLGEFVDKEKCDVLVDHCIDPKALFWSGKNMYVMDCKRCVWFFKDGVMILRYYMDTSLPLALNYIHTSAMLDLNEVESIIL